MDRVLSNIQALSTNQNDRLQLQKYLETATEIIQKNRAVIQDMLTQIDDPVFTLGQMYLIAQLTSNSQYAGIFRNFVANADAQQIRMEPILFKGMCEAFAQHYEKTPRLACGVLRTAIEKVRPSLDSLTPQHVMFLKACLSAKLYSVAAPVVANDVLSVDTKATGVKEVDTLLYFYYKALVHIGLKQFAEAADSYTLLFSIPALSVSLIMIEAYKKFLLVSLIINGKPPTLPKSVPPSLQRFTKGLCGFYLDYATAFATGSVEECSKSLELHAATFVEDRNLGLAKQVRNALVTRRITRLTQTYLTLSLADIAAAVGLESAKVAETTVLRMIDEGEVFARINQRDGMVEFLDSPERFDTAATRDVIHNEIKKCMELSARVRDIDDEISASPSYVFKTQVNDRNTQRWADEEKLGGLGGDEEGLNRGGAPGSLMQSFLNKQ